MREPGELHGNDASFGVIAPLRRPTYAAAALEVMAVAGYGIWMLLGVGLVLNAMHGRGNVLVPLALGALFTGAGLLATSLGVPGAGPWNAWSPRSHPRPTREALAALLAYLPLLAVAGLARGDNDFWATRLAGAALAGAGAASIAYAAHCLRRRIHANQGVFPPQLLLARLVAGGYSGGLWLWACLAGTSESGGPGSMRPWIMALLGLAVVQGLLEGARWQAVTRRPAAAGSPLERPRGRTARFVGALFTYTAPSLTLLSLDLTGHGTALAALAATSCLVGRTIEQHAFRRCLAETCRAVTGRNS